MAQNHYQWTFPSVLSPCKVYGIFGHTGVECQPGTVVRSPEQVNYAQYNQGFMNNQKIYIQTPSFWTTNSSTRFWKQPKSPSTIRLETFARKSCIR